MTERDPFKEILLSVTLYLNNKRQCLSYFFNNVL